MTRQEMIDVLAEYRRPGSAVYDYHFQKLPSEIVQKRNVSGLLVILGDDALPMRVREHAAGALGEIGDQRAVRPLIEALGQARMRRGAAVALGRMKAREAAEALRELAGRVKAAHWALSQVSSPATVEEALEDLRSGQLRLIGSKVERLSDSQAQAVSQEVLRRLQEVLAAKALCPEDRWSITALQFLAPPEAADALTAALRQSINLEGCCGCTLNRCMRALGAIRPPQAIPALADVVCQTEHPRHKQLAVVCIEKILKARGAAAMALLEKERGRLREELARLRDEVAATAAVRPAVPWDHAPGTPLWLAEAERAVKAIGRVLKPV